MIFISFLTHHCADIETIRLCNREKESTENSIWVLHSWQFSVINLISSLIYWRFFGRHYFAQMFWFGHYFYIRISLCYFWHLLFTTEVFTKLLKTWQLWRVTFITLHWTYYSHKLTKEPAFRALKAEALLHFLSWPTTK